MSRNKIEFLQKVCLEKKLKYLKNGLLIIFIVQVFAFDFTNINSNRVIKATQ